MLLRSVILYALWSYAASFPVIPRQSKVWRRKIRHTTTIHSSPVAQSPNHDVSDRRDVLGRILLSNVLSSLISLPKANAEEGALQTEQLTQAGGGGIRPFAPLEALVPAARVKYIIDRSVVLASGLLEKTGNSPNILKQQELQDLLLRPQNVTRAAPLPPALQPAKPYLDSYKQARNELPLLAKPGALLVQTGDIMAWTRLKRQEMVQEERDEFRAALNVYTNALQFDAERYVLTAPKNVRKQLIRDDRLPDIKSVWEADLGLRYLYRNQILSAMDEARAEMAFQLKQKQLQERNDVEAPIDASELLVLLQNAQKASDQWFSFIEEKDLIEAMQVVQQEMNTSGS